MAPIRERPEEVEGRLVPGHWEGDFIKGAGNRSAVGTLVERTSRYVILARMGGPARTRRWRASPASSGPSRPACARPSPTPGQGNGPAPGADREHGRQGLLRRPAKPLAEAQQRERQRPDRQHLPKGTDLSQVSQAELNAIARLLNNRPRKVLGFKTPTEVYQEELLRACKGLSLCFSIDDYTKQS